MGLIRLTLINAKRYLKNPMIILMSFVLPVIMIVSLSKLANENSKVIGMIDNDKSEYSEELVKSLSEDYKVLTLSGEAEDHFDALKDDQIGALYIIGDNFENNINNKIQPKVKSYKRQNENGAIIAENTIDNFIKGKLENNLESGLSDNYIETKIQKDESKDNSDFNFVALMICYLMMIGSSIIAQDIIKLKEWKVLKRTIVTPNSDRRILGGMFLATFIIQSVLSSLAFVVASKVIYLPNANLLMGILVVTLCSLLSTALVTATTRWIKNPTIANMVIVILGFISFFVAILNMNLTDYSNTPEILTRLSVISPFYWFIEILNNSSLIKSVIVIILISGVFFTCGSFKLRDFVKED